MNSEFDHPLEVISPAVVQRDRIEDRLAELADTADANLASEFYKKLALWISDFDKGLDGRHEVGVRLVSFGQTLVFHLTDMTYWDPSLISFVGITDDGEPVELIQHISQISILLMKLPRLDTSCPKVPIGFALRGAGEEDDDDDDV